MENKNDDKKIYDSTVYDSFKSHQTEYQKLLLKKENPNDKFTDQDAEDLEYHKKRIDYIKKFAKGKQVPLVYVPDDTFSHTCKPDTYSTINSLYTKKTDAYDLELNELLYPAWCCDEKKDKMLVENSQCAHSNLQDKASPYKPNNSFLIKQKGDVNTCYFMSLMIGIVSHGGEYIKNKMIRDYPDEDGENIDDIDDDAADLDLKGRSDKAVVRLFDEDGLPVDIVVDKTRPDKDTRAMWIIVLEKAVCVMMSQNKFKNCYKNEFAGHTKQIAQGINWYDLGKGYNYEIDYTKINGKFNMDDIDYASEAQGIKLILGKSYEQQWIQNKSTDKEKYVDYIKKCMDSGKLVIVATGNNTAGKLEHTNHIFYVSSIDMNKEEITTLDSMSGKITTSFNEFLNHIVQIHVTDFPDTEKTIEQEIDLNKIQEIENEVINKTIDNIDNINEKANIKDKQKDNNSEVPNIKDSKDEDKNKEVDNKQNSQKTIEQEVDLNKDVIDNTNKKTDVSDEDGNKNNKDVQIKNNKNKNKEQETKIDIDKNLNKQDIKESLVPAESKENNLKSQMEISKQQDNQDNGMIENKINKNSNKNIEQQNQTDTDNDIKNENSSYLKLISEDRVTEIGKGSIKSINDLFKANTKSSQIRALILNNPEAFSDSAFVGFDLNNDDNKTKLGLTSNTPQSGRKRRIFLAVLLYICFGLGYFTGWSKKLLDAADSINQHNQYLAALNNLIKTKNKNYPLSPRGKQVINKEKSEIGQEQNRTSKTKDNEGLLPLHMVQENTQTTAKINYVEYEDKSQ